MHSFMFSRSRRQHTLDIWPGFVDAMATLLMVIVFVLMTFVVAQLYLTDAIKGKEDALSLLDEQLLSLKNTLDKERLSKEEAIAHLKTLEKAMTLLEQQLVHMKASLKESEASLEKETALKERSLHTINDLNEQIAHLNYELKRLNDALAQEESKSQASNAMAIDLKTKLDAALLEKVEELQAMNAKLKAALEGNEALEKEIKTLKDPKKLGLTQYRSEFFAKLAKVLGERGDIRVVGDRFVFQSEVLFDKGSSDIKPEGLKQLKTFAQTLKDITASIPKDIPWILRIDGHTDKLAINTSQFPSNWELSSARAIAVLKALIKEGISAQHLVAAGFGEHQPLSQTSDEAAMARNRRIEFKLDQR